IDFGMARLQHGYVEEWLRPGSVAGTLEFMAPEQAWGDNANLTPRSDIFSLGGVLFYLLTGVPPFRGRSSEETLENARMCLWKNSLLEDRKTPARLQSICAKALAKYPEQRYATAEEFAADLEKAAGPRPSRLIWYISAMTVFLGAL